MRRFNTIFTEEFTHIAFCHETRTKLMKSTLTTSIN